MTTVKEVREFFAPDETTDAIEAGAQSFADAFNELEVALLRQQGFEFDPEFDELEQIAEMAEEVQYRDGILEIIPDDLVLGDEAKKTFIELQRLMTQYRRDQEDG